TSATSVLRRPSDRLQKLCAHDWPCTSSRSRTDTLRTLALPERFPASSSVRSLVVSLAISARPVPPEGKFSNCEVKRRTVVPLPTRALPTTSRASLAAPVAPARRPPAKVPPAPKVAAPLADTVPVTDALP